MKQYYEIRIESIGGLGANLCGKMLGEMALRYLNLNASSFSSYGSEKTGTPVKAFVRLCSKDKDINVHYPIRTPDLLVIFHKGLCKSADVWKGCNPDTKVVVAMPKEARVPLLDTVEEMYGVDAVRIAMETHSRINTVMLGAILRVMEIDRKVGEKIITDSLGRKYPGALAGNLEGFYRGYEEIYLIDTWEEEKMAQSNELKWGYNNAPMGGINPMAGNSITTDVSASRQGYFPIFLKEKCINCGRCHSTCPDMVFQFREGEYQGKKMMINQGLDYHHCKGCLRCVVACPVNALVRGIEEEHPVKEHFLPNQELLHGVKLYEKGGPDGYITSESHFTEKRMEGGEV